MLKILVPTALLLVSCTSAPTGTAEAQVAEPYTLDTCVVMDSKLGSMGDAITRVYKGQEVKFCCQPCVEEFESDPEFYLEKMNAK